MTFTQRKDGPTKEELLKVYNGLDREVHEHDLLPLETRLPDELKVHSRDQYRIIMTMILCQQTADKPLTESLAKLFKSYPSFEELRHLEKNQIKETLSGMGFGVHNLKSGNGARLWSLTQCYFKKWGETITKENIASLRSERGFGPHFVRLLQAYYLGDNTVIPLDGPALEALYDPLFPDYLNFTDDEIREDIEHKLRGEDSVSLIDFHEMLRFARQYIDKRQPQEVIIGWNAWRLLCSQERDRITKDCKWIRDHLVKDDNLAKDLWNFYKEKTSQS